MSEESQSTDEPKIMVDEDWKAQVEREKQEADAKATGSSTDAEPEASQGQQEIPPASFQLLMSTMATQAMVALGLFPDPATGKPSPNRPLAKHFIDMIGMLEEKTKGNLTNEEAEQIKETLHQLRMIFVSSKDDAVPATTEAPKEEKPPIIELP